MKKVTASIIAIFMMAAIAGGRQELDKLKPVLDQKWKELAKTISSFLPPNRTESWDYRITVPFPESWPPKAGNGLVYYAVPYGLNIRNLADAEYVGAPWARIMISPGRSSQIKYLTTKILRLDRQGVRPLFAKEIEIFDSREAVKASLSKLTALPDPSSLETKRIRDFYCLWMSTNGVLAGQLAKDHKTFFDWLGCQK
jgi:hypothetical protein